MITLNNDLKIEIFTVIKNDAKILPLFIQHYRERFPGCVINVFDNHSTDEGVELCLNAGCNVGVFDEYTEPLLQEFRNNIWKQSDADWVIVCDANELLDISAQDIAALPAQFNVIHADYYNMVDITGDGSDYAGLTYGCPTYPASKCVMFKKSSIKEMNYSIGAHSCNPKPAAYYSEPFKLWHYEPTTMTYQNFADSIERLLAAAGKVSPLTPELQKEAYQKSVLDRAVKVK